MSNWTETLTQFSSAIRTGTEFSPGIVNSPHYPETRGIEVYRNNYRGNLHDTMACAYPVLRQLVGEDFFRLLAKNFIERHASRSGNMHLYGSEMAAFLMHFEHTQHLAYLPDMARLEWAHHQAYFAHNVMPFEVSRLATVPAEAYTDLRWRLHPGCTLLSSAYPISAIWQAHQNGLFEYLQLDLHSGGDTLLVHRDELSVEISCIAPASLHWLTQLQQGIAMGIASEETINLHPDFDLATTFRHWIAQGVLIDFDIPHQQQEKS